MKTIIFLNKSQIVIGMDELDKLRNWLGDNYFIIYKEIPNLSAIIKIEKLDNDYYLSWPPVVDSCSSMNGHETDEKGNCKICGAIKIGKKKL